VSLAVRQLLVLLGLAALALGACAVKPAAEPARTEQVRTETAPVAPVGDPSTITIPSLKLSAPVDATGLAPDGTVVAPPMDRPERAAWVDVGPHPGEQGRALIVGHVNGGGHPGVFADLATIDVGAEIQVADADGAVQRFTVTRIGQAPKSAFPAGAVYGDTDRPELVLVTCGGDFDAAAGHYVANTIVFATVAQPAPAVTP
jgi:hypothetical protein